MAKVTITFDTDNAAFYYEDESREPEPDAIARVVRSVADAVAAGRGNGLVRDDNGNTIGSWEVGS